MLSVGSCPRFNYQKLLLTGKIHGLSTARHLRRTLVLTGSGVFLGTLGALATTRVPTKLLFEVTPTDPLTFLVVTAALIAVALCSAWRPARRAADVYPLIALRHDTELQSNDDKL